MGLFGAILGQQRVQIIQFDQTVIQLDCSLQETHSRESPPTEFPVENGDVISDHVIIKPFVLEVQGVISDTPIGGVKGLITQAATSLTSTLTGPAGLVTAAAGAALFSALQGAESPSVAAFAQLLGIQQAAQPVTILTSLFRYESMWMKSLKVPRDAQTGKVLMFTAEFVQLILVTPQSVNVSIFANPALSSAEANLGEQGNNISKRYQQGFSTSNGAVHAVVKNGIGG